MIGLMRTCSACSGLTPRGDVCLHCAARTLVVIVAATAGTMLLAACYGPSGEYRRQHAEAPGSAVQPAALDAAPASAPAPAPAPAPAKP
jgi:hypothetical protein